MPYKSIMKRNYYIFSSGRLIRRQNTLYFEQGKAEEPEEMEEKTIVEIEVDDDSISTDDGEEIESSEPKRLPRKPLPAVPAKV